MKRSATIILAAFALSGCHILFPEDPRLGQEQSDECLKRVAGLLGPGTGFEDYTAEMGVPTFTFDITKMAFEDMQRLMVEGSDDTAGARAMAATNEASTAVDVFMATKVDEKGAFFTGRDPALYRVRGGLQPVSTMIASGCARQQEGMRLIMIDVAPVPAEPEPDPEEGPETPTDNESQ